MITLDRIAEYEIDLAWYPKIVWAYSKKYKSEPVGLKLVGKFADRHVAMVEVIHHLIADIRAAERTVTAGLADTGHS